MSLAEAKLHLGGPIEGSGNRPDCEYSQCPHDAPHQIRANRDQRFERSRLNCKEYLTPGGRGMTMGIDAPGTCATPQDGHEDCDQPITDPAQSSSMIMTRFSQLVVALSAVRITLSARSNPVIARFEHTLTAAVSHDNLALFPLCL